MDPQAQAGVGTAGLRTPQDGRRALVADVRAFLADQGALHLRGLALGTACLRRRVSAPAPELDIQAPAPAVPRGPSAAPVAPAQGVVAQARSAAPAPAPLPLVPAEGGDATSLPELAQVLGDCQRCALAASRTSIVFGSGHTDAELMFVGEAPGRDEDLQGEPFVGEAGRLLERMLAAMGLRREAVYISNVIKCRPPKNRFPEPDEVARCSPFVLQQVRLVRPRVLVLLGRLAAHTVLGTRVPISRLRGQWAQLGEVAVMPTFHPAYLLRNPADKGLVWQDLQAVMQRLGLPAVAAQRRSGPSG